jgi:hypothetical protein
MTIPALLGRAYRGFVALAPPLSAAPRYWADMLVVRADGFVDPDPAIAEWTA